MPSVSIRRFGPHDLAPLVELWNRCLPKDAMSEERFWHLFVLDSNFDAESTLVAESGGEIVGALQVMARRVPLGDLGLQPELGWLTFFFTHPYHRREGLASRMLDAGLAWLRDRGRTTVMCNGYSPTYAFPGVDVEYADALAFLQKRGFEAVSEPVAMGMDLEGVRTPEPVRERMGRLEADGWSFRSFCRDDTLPLLAFAAGHFPHWRPCLLDTLQRGNTDIQLATRHNEIAGFAQWQNPHTDPPSGAPGRFGPFGIRQDLRGQGIGSALFYSLVERVSAEGADHLWFGWAGGRNFSFYERAGCHVTRRYKLLKRLL